MTQYGNTEYFCMNQGLFEYLSLEDICLALVALEVLVHSA